jgi:hypothetical protein
VNKKTYCQNLDIFTELWNDWFSSAYSDGICVSDNDVLQKANNLYNFMNSNKHFIDKMLALTLGVKSNKKGGLFYWNSFKSSYHQYIKDPTYLCLPFSEFICSLSEFLVTGGCRYLFRKGKPCPNYSC